MSRLEIIKKQLSVVESLAHRVSNQNIICHISESLLSIWWRARTELKPYWLLNVDLIAR